MERSRDGPPAGQRHVQNLPLDAGILGRPLRGREALLDERLQLVERLAVAGLGFARERLERVLELAEQARAPAGEADAHGLHPGGIAARLG